MIDITREFIAYSIIGVVVVVAIPLLAIFLRRRKHAKLRRRGIKEYGR